MVVLMWFAQSCQSSVKLWVWLWKVFDQPCSEKRIRYTYILFAIRSCSNRNVYFFIWLISFMVVLFSTQVVLVYLSGLTLSLTSGATYGNKKYVQHVTLQIHGDGLCTIVSRLIARSLIVEVESW